MRVLCRPPHSARTSACFESRIHTIHAAERRSNDWFSRGMKVMDVARDWWGSIDYFSQNWLTLQLRRLSELLFQKATHELMNEAPCHKRMPWKTRMARAEFSPASIFISRRYDWVSIGVSALYVSLRHFYIRHVEVDIAIDFRLLFVPQQFFWYHRHDACTRFRLRRRWEKKEDDFWLCWYARRRLWTPRERLPACALAAAAS